MIAVIIYGEFRTFELNLKRNIIELLDEINKPVHFYILSEYCEDYDTKKKKNIDIIYSINSNYEIKYFENILTCSHYNKEKEEIYCNNYNNIPYNQKRDEFTPKLFYRRCLINEIMNSFQITYDKVISTRLFDVIIKKYKSLSFINNNDDILYYGIDTLIIGSMTNVNIFFNCDVISNIIQIDYNDFYLFREFYSKNDFYLSKILPKLALETIYNSILFKKFYKKCVNLRFDYTRQNVNYIWNSSTEINTKSANFIIDCVSPFVKDDYLFILHCPNRH